MMIRNQNCKLAAAAAVLLPLAAPVRADSGWGLLNMTPGVTDISRKIYDLHMEVFWICVAIAVVVFGWMIWSLIAFRKSKGAVADTTLVHNTRVEIIWTTIPVFILIAVAVPATRTLVDIEDTSVVSFNSTVLKNHVVHDIVPGSSVIARGAWWVRAWSVGLRDTEK
jgi:heme/copper-type cytochrome/quinol oxidase subunit 2